MQDTLSVTIAVVVFIVVFTLIITERIHRSVIAFFGAVLIVVLGNIFDFYHISDAFHAIDFNTLGLLAGMMVLVAILESTGFFQYLAILSAKKTKGDPWKLLLILGTVTTVLSCILDNVTTVLLISPVTIVIARIANISPIPILIAEALLSNTGGVATLVGDPPNVMIGSAADFSFIDFLTHIAPAVIICWGAVLGTLRLVFHKELAKKPEHIDAILGWDEKSALKDTGTCIKLLGILGLVILLFFFHHLLHIPPSFVSLIGASLALLVVNPNKDPQQYLTSVEWSVLVFFGSLFVLVGGLEHVGVLDAIATLITDQALQRPVMTAILLLWFAALASALVDNIPFTVAMIPVITHLEQLGVNANILWWALALGVGFGGNGSPIGSTANVVVVTKSEQTDDPIRFGQWFKSGTLAMIVACAVASVYIFIFQGWLSG